MRPFLFLLLTLAFLPVAAVLLPFARTRRGRALHQRVAGAFRAFYLRHV